LNVRFQDATPIDTLAYAAERFGASLAVACSLGVEDVAVLHMVAALRAAPERLPRVFVLDTGRLPEQSYELLERLRLRFAVPIELYFPDGVGVETLVRTKGPLSFRNSIEDRRECCAIRKLAPLSRALEGADAWVTGLRRGQSTGRAETERFELDAVNGGRVKVNPLAHWTDEQVWRYVRENDVPYSTLHDEGYPSIGCAPCTRAVTPGHDARSGRWWWETTLEEGRECGLHSPRRPRH
jgi:phosphoadenosine phosphosulfate reductase